MISPPSATETGPAASRLRRDTVVVLGASGTGQLLAAGLFLLIARAAGPESFGGVMAAAGAGTVAAALADFGSTSVLIRELAAGRLDQPDAGRLVAGKAAVLGTAAAAGTAVLAAVGGATGSWTCTPVAAYAAVLVLTQTLVAPLRASGRTWRVATVTVADKGSALALAGLLAASGSLEAGSLWLCLLLGGTVSCALSLMLWPAAARSALFSAHQPLLGAAPWAGCRHFGISSGLIGLQSLDTTLVAAVAGTSAAGSYAAVNRWTAPMGLVSTAYTQATYPHVTAAPDPATALTRLRHGQWLLPPVICGVIAVVLAAPRVVDVLLGADFASAAPVLQLLALGLVPAVLNQPLAMFLQARGRERAVSRTLGVAIPAQLCLLALLGAGRGAPGAAAAFALAQTGLLVRLLTLVRREVRA